MTSKAILQRTYRATYTIEKDIEEANFCITLECNKDAKTFDMMLYTHDSFLNGAVNVCSWPVEDWTREQVRECVRIFHEEYLFCAANLSQLVSDEFLVDTKIIYNADELQIRTVAADSDIVEGLWDALNAARSNGNGWRGVLGWTPRLEGNKFGVCDSIRDCGYVEDPFPFIGAINAFDQPTKSNTEMYGQNLPTLMALATEFMRK